jgi:hypothetical protein
MNSLARRPLLAIAASVLVIPALLTGCQDEASDSNQRPSTQRPTRHLGLWVDDSEDFEAEVEFYDDGGIYYYYSDPSEQREGSGLWRIEQDRYVFEMDNDMTYHATVTFPQEDTMVIATDAAGSWTFQRSQPRKQATEQ